MEKYSIATLPAQINFGVGIDFFRISFKDPFTCTFFFVSFTKSVLLSKRCNIVIIIMVI